MDDSTADEWSNKKTKVHLFAWICSSTFHATQMATDYFLLSCRANCNKCVSLALAYFYLVCMSSFSATRTPWSGFTDATLGKCCCPITHRRAHIRMTQARRRMENDFSTRKKKKYEQVYISLDAHSLSELDCGPRIRVDIAAAMLVSNFDSIRNTLKRRANNNMENQINKLIGGRQSVRLSDNRTTTTASEKEKKTCCSAHVCIMPFDPTPAVIVLSFSGPTL